MRIVHLTSSTFFGGPERQMLGLAEALPAEYQSYFLSFAERGRCLDFVDQVQRRGFTGRMLEHDTPRLYAAYREIADYLSGLRADLLCCHGYKADLVGRPAARSVGVRVIAVSRGWTGENAKVRLYESADRRFLGRMDAVVCVSDGQAAKVRAAGVQVGKVHVIRNSARETSFRAPCPDRRRHLESYFADPGDTLVLAAARLSPEKGFADLVEAVRRLAPDHPGARFLVFGDGVLKAKLTRQIRDAALEGKFILGGFRDDLDVLMPNADLFVLPSYREGLPNVVLEACAAGVPVVATAVGGTPEVLIDGHTGYLVEAGDVPTLAERIARLLARPDERRAFGAAGRERVREHFTFAAQARQYQELFDQLVADRSPCFAA